MRNKNTQKSVGTRIAELRKSKNMTQDNVAEKLKITREAVSGWERSTRDMATYDVVAMADLFGVSCDYLLRGVQAENSTLNKEYGLSDTALETLKMFKECSRKDEHFFNQARVRTIELLLENLRFIDLLSRYFFQRFPSNIDDFDIHAEITATSKEDGEKKYLNKILFDVNNIPDVFLTQVNDYLKNIRQQAQKQTRVQAWTIDEV